MAGRGTGTMAADMALPITAGTRRRIKAMAMLLHTMAAIMVPGTGALFVPYTVPHLGCMVFLTFDGDQARRWSLHNRKVAEMSAAFFVCGVATPSAGSLPSNQLGSPQQLAVTTTVVNRRG